MDGYSQIMEEDYTLSVGGLREMRAQLPPNATLHEARGYTNVDGELSTEHDGGVLV